MPNLQHQNLLHTPPHILTNFHCQYIDHNKVQYVLAGFQFMTPIMGCGKNLYRTASFDLGLTKLNQGLKLTF